MSKKKKETMLSNKTFNYEKWHIQKLKMVHKAHN